MLELEVARDSALRQILFEQKGDFSIPTNSLAEKVKLLIVRDLFRLGWEMNFKGGKLYINPPESYDKETIRNSMLVKRQEIIAKNLNWINKHAKLAWQNLANGEDAWNSEIDPVVEVCESQKQFDIFRLFRFYWSSPYSEYVGRRIKILVRDNALPNKPIIGIAALGSSIVHIPDRDKWIGWDVKNRTKNLVYTMDAYVLGALPPYNDLLGGKLIAYIIASNEVREIFENKYFGKVTNISKRTANQLACIFTTSLYGNSSQYNRLKFHDELLYKPIGKTKGYGTLHLTDETFDAMRELLKDKKIVVSNRFGDGPIWRMRVIRESADSLGFNSDFLLKHSFQRHIFAIPLARNFKEFLHDRESDLKNHDYPIGELISHWKERWLKKRKMSLEIKERVISFAPEKFQI